MVATLHVDGRGWWRRRRGRAQTDVLQQYVARVVVAMVVMVAVHAGTGPWVVERVGGGRMLSVVVLVVLSFARERQHRGACGQVLPAPLVHAVAHSWVG